MGFGFSNEEAKEFFSQKNLKHYYLHFSNGESSQFPMAIYHRLELEPKMIIVNSQFYFNKLSRKIGAQILNSNMYSFYSFSRWFQTLHRSVCGDGSGAFVRKLAAYDPCVGTSSVFRSRSDGSWIHNVDEVHKNFEMIRAVTNKEYLYSLVGLARNFVAETGLPRECIFFTDIPEPEGNANYGAELAAATGVPYIDPQVEGLATLDGSHLDKASAKRWTHEFFQDFQPAFEKCMASRK